MNARHTLLVVLLASVTALACATSTQLSTQFKSTWVGSFSRLGPLEGKRVAAFYFSDSVSERQPIESALARELTRRGAVGVAGFEILEDVDASDRDVSR